MTDYLAIACVYLTHMCIPPVNVLLHALSSPVPTHDAQSERTKYIFINI